MNPKIIVIGSGASGIAAASKLLQNGLKNLTILEAENRIGGRIATHSFSSNYVDLGAQWCHGEKDNVVYELAHTHNLLESATTKYNKFLYIKSNGEIIDPEIGNQLTDLALSIIEGSHDELKDYEGSLGGFIVTQFFKALENPEYKEISPELSKQFLEFFHKFENSIEASDSWYDTSAKGYLAYWDCEGDRLLNWKDKGYKTLFDLLTKKYPDPCKKLPIDDKILLNKTVEKIYWNQGAKSTIEVQCEDGSIYTADHVIVTVSLGVLKERHLRMFSPQLPIIKRNAIEGLNFGTVNKIYLEFSEPFWEKDWKGFSLLWNNSDLDEVRKTDNTWLEDVFGIYTVDFQPNVLCGWISGVNGRRMELATEANVRQGMLFLLRKFLKNKNISEPLRVLRSNWFTNRNFRGSYSFRSLTTDKIGTVAAHLALPLKNSMGIEVLQFAGEATHDHYYSTVHGAVESGYREAKRIIEFYQKNKSHL